VSTGQLVTQAPLAHLRWGSTGRPVVMLHGVGGGRLAWDDAVSGTGAALGQAGWQAVAADFQGYGLSPRIDPYTLAGMAASVVALIDHLGLGPAVLVGHSMGGMVAQEVVATCPDRVAGLVLAGTSPAFGKPDGDWQQQFLQSRFAPLDAGLGMAGLAAQLVPSMVGPACPDAARAAAQGLMSQVPEATYRSAVSALVAFDRRAMLPAIAVPALVITGEHDRTAAPEVARRMAERITGAQLAIVPGAGHLLNMELPQHFNQALLAFLTPLR